MKDKIIEFNVPVKIELEKTITKIPLKEIIKKILPELEKEYYKEFYETIGDFFDYLKNKYK